MSTADKKSKSESTRFNATVETRAKQMAAKLLEHAQGRIKELEANLQSVTAEKALFLKRAETAERNLNLLEGMHGVRGIRAEDAIRPAPEPKGRVSAKDIQARLAREKDPVKRAAIRKEFSEAVNEGRIDKD